ncbi:MAG: hypothetical protein AB4042_15790 [Leptolyngbyaceae cyanobacterium]
MKIDPVIALTLMLFSIIVAATSVSMSWGYALGRSALRGVTQPDVRPSAGFSQSGSSAQANNGGNLSTRIEAARNTEMVFWSEATILEDVKTRINYRAVPTTTTLPSPGE